MMKIPDYKKNTLIEVDWIDIISDPEWMSEQKAAIQQPAFCKSVGYFLNKDKTVLRLSPMIQIGDKAERDITIIPLGVVKKIRRKK